MNKNKNNIEKLVNQLEVNGDLLVNSRDESILIQSIDDKEGYSYITNNHHKFKDSTTAVKWVIEESGGMNNIISIESGLE